MPTEKKEYEVIRIGRHTLGKTCDGHGYWLEGESGEG